MRRRPPSRCSQTFSKAAGRPSARRRFEVLDGGGDVGLGDELVPEIAADEGGEVVSAGGLAGAVEADDAAGGVEYRDEGVDGVEHGGDEVALDGEGGLDALAGAGGSLHEADGGGELDRGHGLAGKDGHGLELEGVELAARGRQGRRASRCGCRRAW